MSVAVHDPCVHTHARSNEPRSGPGSFTRGRKKPLLYRLSNLWLHVRELAAIPGFFLSSFFFMLLWGVIAPKIGLVTIDYVTSMLITITLWIAIAPLTAAAARKRR